MSKDVIKREDAIDAIECVTWYHQNRHKDMVSGANSAEDQAWYKAEDIYDALETVPSADRPQGEWEIVGKNHPYKRCPFCKRVKAFTDTRFCDWCGARMKGADDEDNH